MLASKLRWVTGVLLALLHTLPCGTDVSLGWEAWRWQKVEAPTASFGADGDGYAVKLTLQGAVDLPFATPVTFGVPLPRGVVKDPAALGLFGVSGRPVSAQFKPLAYWADGSTKWVLISFLVGEEPGRDYVLKRGVELRPAGGAIKAVATPEGVVVDTGVLRATFARGGRGFLESVAVDTDRDGKYEPEEHMGVPAASSFIHLVDAAAPGGRRAGRYVDGPELRRSVEIVEAGPVRAVVKVAGEHISKSGRATAPFFVWVSFYAGQSFFRIWHTFVVAEPVSDVFVRTVGIRIAMPSCAIRMRAGCDGTAVSRALSDESEVYAVQDSTALDGWAEQAEPTFWIVETEAGDERVVAEGRLCGGYLEAEGPRVRVAVCMPRTWHEFPKELAVDNREAVVDAQFWPMHKFEPLDLRTLIERGSPALASLLTSVEGETWRARPRRASTVSGMGMAKSHEILCWFHGKDAAPAELASIVALLDAPPLLTAAPEYYRHCAAFGSCHVADRREFPTHSRLLAESCDFLMKSQGKRPGWLGFLGHGDFRRRCSAGGQAWDAFVAGWCNGADEVAWPFFAQFMSSSDRRYFDFGAAAVRHVMDVDTLHSLDTVVRSALPCRPGPDHSQAGTLADASPHALAAYYLLTGNLRARDVLDELAEAAWEGGRAPLSDRELSKAAELAAVQVEVSPSSGNRALVEKLLGQLRARVARIGVDPVTGRVIDVGTGRCHDGDLDEFVLPALAYAYRVTDDRSVIDAMKQCVAAAWPQFHCLGALDALYWATQDRAYAQAAALGVRELGDAIGVKAHGVTWTSDVLGQSTWPQLSRGLSTVYAARPAVQPENLEEVTHARRHEARSGHDRPPDTTFKTVPLNELCNWSPVSPLACTSRPELVTDRDEGIGLKEGQIGFDFGMGHWVEPGFHCVTSAHRYPSLAGDPSPLGGFAGLPFGCTARYCGIPFRLASPQNGDAALVLEQKSSYEIAVNQQVRRLHFLGGVCLRPVVESGIGARVVLLYEDGEEKRVDLRNFSDYQPCGFPPVFVKPSVRLAAELTDWHVNVLTVPVEPKVLSRVRLEGGERDHRVVVFALTSEEDRVASTSPAERVEVAWELVSFDHVTRAFAADVPKGHYRFDIELSAEAAVAFDVDVCGRRSLRHAVPSGRLRASLPAVWCAGDLTLRCSARPLGIESRPEWDLAVAGVWRVGGDAEDAGEASAASASTAVSKALRYGWEPLPENGNASLARSVGLPAKPRSDYQPGRLLGDGCAPTGLGDGRLRFWMDVPDGQYEVALYICSTSSSVCSVEVRTVGADSGATVRAEPAHQGGQYRRVARTEMTGHAHDGRLALELRQQTGPRGQWALCAVLVRQSH